MGWGAAGEDTTSRCGAARHIRRDEHGLRGMVAIKGESNQDERWDDAAAARKTTGEDYLLRWLSILALGDFAPSYHASCAAWATGGDHGCWVAFGYARGTHGPSAAAVTPGKWPLSRGG